MDQQDYVTLQLINACLRENTAELISKGHIEIHTGQYWLCVNHLLRPLRLQVTPYDYMQYWLACFPYWQEKYQQWQTCIGFNAWLALLTGQEDENHYLIYLKALKAVCHQRERCQQAYHQYCHTIQVPLKKLNWGERARYAQRMAGYQDEPYSFVNKGKSLLTDEQYIHYSAEGGQGFSLEWLAIPRQSMTLSESRSPSWWPHPTQLGLNDVQTDCHFLLPVHPITMAQLNALPSGVLRATRCYLSVYPTQSITNLQVANYPEQHLQLPLLLANHAQSAVLIAPTTAPISHQGITEILLALTQQDPLLHRRLFFVENGYYGYVKEMPALSFLLQCYPKKETETLVPVAALGTTMPDGYSYLDHLLSQLGRTSVATWWEQYCRIMAEVHLTLWLRYGIVLDGLPQNMLLSFTPDEPLYLIMTRNGGATLLGERFIAACPHLEHQQRIQPEASLWVDDENILAQKFITLILQRSLAATLESLVDNNVLIRNWGYKILRDTLKSSLATLATQGIDTQFAHQTLFEAKYQPIITNEFLKEGLVHHVAQKVNYYHRGPNFLRMLPK